MGIVERDGRYGVDDDDEDVGGIRDGVHIRKEQNIMT